MSKKRSLEDEINEFLESWDCRQQIEFLRDMVPLFELYDVDNEDDWVRASVGMDNERNIRLIRTVYLVSRLAAFHAVTLCSINVHFKDLWKRMEKHSAVKQEGPLEEEVQP